jgi:hypothetical protein
MILGSVASLLGFAAMIVGLLFGPTVESAGSGAN